MSEYYDNAVAFAQMNLINLMEAEGLSQLHVGEYTGLGQGTISKLVNGTLDMTLWYACEICNAFEIPLAVFIGDEDEPTYEASF